MTPAWTDNSRENGAAAGITQVLFQTWRCFFDLEL